MHREREKVVAPLVVMRHFSVLRVAPRACADFCDPTAVSRIIRGCKVEVILDYNHPLAGKVLYFYVMVLDIKKPQAPPHGE